MLHVSAGNIFTYLNYALSANGKLLVLSNFNRDLMSVAGVCANTGLGNEAVRIIGDGELVASYSEKMDMENHHVKISMGRDTVYQGVSVSSLVNTEFLFLRQERREEDFYSYLMDCFTFPLLREWMPYIWQQAERQKHIAKAEVSIIGETDLFYGYEIVRTAISNDALKNILREGLASGEIRIAKEKQKPLKFQDMDDYFQRYGHKLVDNLEKLLKPLSPMKDKVERIAFINKRPFPQQAAIINGAVACLKARNYAFLIESMGAGKTLQGMGVAEFYFNQKYLDAHPEKSVRDIYMDGKLVAYRVIIMCPPHLVEKWEKALLEEIAYAHVEVIVDISQLIALKKRGREPLGKEYYILSKDSGKLSYSHIPVPYQIKDKRPLIPTCKNCGREFPAEENALCKCGCNACVPERQVKSARGLICPECGELLLPADGSRMLDEETGEFKILMPEDFNQHTATNHNCRCCKAALWAPACKPVDRRILFRKPKPKPIKWKRISHYANRALKGRKSVWVMASREAYYRKINNVKDEEVEEMEPYGPRRFGRSRYIKKHLKGFFELAIFDEVQEYKAGGSAQGYAMHDLIKASKKHLALTGTIAGGYASDLFYTLYRLDPARMKSKGYEYGNAGERGFVEKYGTVETVYEVAEKGRYNTMSRGRVVTPQRCLPGISPLVFLEFLLDTALFLDLSDLSRYLPMLYEKVMTVPLEDEIQTEYQTVRDILKMRMLNGDKGLMGSFLQFSLSYTDMPYRRPPILSPETGETIAEPRDFSFLIKDGRLLNKERTLARLTTKELGEGRNCFIYCEYTGEGEGSISYRLKEVLEKNCVLSPFEIIVIESSYPAAAKREAWMHQKAAEGAKVFITNAKCVSTGLDFAFSHLGKKYNYPTIIFYQTGYDMIKIWQGSHRHHRLNQEEECRTFFIVSERTIQIDAVELVATKEVATSAIQGKFSSEGLSAMARGIDPRVVLAQAAAEKSEQKERGLQKMMDVLNKQKNRDKGEVQYEKMQIFSELTGLSEVPLLEDPLSEFEWITGQDVMDLISFDSGMGVGAAQREAHPQHMPAFHRAEPEDASNRNTPTESLEAPQKTSLEGLLDLIF